MIVPESLSLVRIKCLLFDIRVKLELEGWKLLLLKMVGVFQNVHIVLGLMDVEAPARRLLA